MTYRKKLIEVALPLEAINKASAREKSIRHGHPSTLHLWWARRPLAAARAVIFTSLVDDPDDPNALPAFVEACKALPKGANVESSGDTPRMRLFDFIERLVTWEATTDEDILNTARELIQIATEGNPPPLLDPFAGGGSIPLEAQRLGLEAHASDLNPVAVMINKAQIEIPPRFANMPPVNPRDREKMFGEGGKADKTWKGAAGLAADVRYYGEWMREKAFEKIGHLYPTHNGETVIAWLWARTVKSPNPAVNVQVPLVRSFILSKKKGRERWAKPIVEGNTIRFEVTKGKPPKDQTGTMNRRGGMCIISGEPIPFEYIREEGRAGRMKASLMAFVTKTSGGRVYYSPTKEQIQRAQQDKPDWTPNLVMSTHSQYMSPPRYGMTSFADLFSDRQLVMLVEIAKLVNEVKKKVENDIASYMEILQDYQFDTYSSAIALYMGMIVSKATVSSNTLARWRSGEDKTAPAFGRQAIAMVWDYAETNPFAGAGGDLFGIADGLSKAIERFRPITNSSVKQIDATKIQHERGDLLVSTDPPYYDNVPYADLSDFSYVWLRYVLRNEYPDEFGTVLVPKEEELVADHERFGGREAAAQHFEIGLLKTFSLLRNFANPDYPLTVYYAFKQSDNTNAVASSGWETLLEGLVRASYIIEGTWPMRTESASRLRNMGANALASSIVLVCRSRPDDAPNSSRRAFLDALRRELPKALKEMQSGNIAPVDLAQASIGPGMAIYSRYSKVLEADGRAMTVRTALGLINQELDAHLSEHDGDIDADTRFAIDWFKQFGFEEGDFGQADVLARGKNTSVKGVEAAGVVDAGRGKVKLRHWSEYDPGAWNPQDDKRPTVWEATHHLIERLNSHGETGSAMLMNKMPPDMAAEARQLAYRLYNICERKKWSDHARDYNALVVSWSGIGEESARLRDAAASGDATQQPKLFDD